jgi:integrase
MSYSFARGKWEVRWRDATGRQRSRRFGSEEVADEFDKSIHDHELVERRRESKHGRSGGVYPYETASGTKWRYVARRSDGSLTSKRGFTSETAARTARRRITEKRERGEIVHTKETFGSFFPRWLKRRKPYLSEGTWKAYERDGRLRLLPALEPIPLGRLDVDHVRDLVDELAESMEAGEIAPKTINNTLGTLVVALNEAVKVDRLMASNPALEVQRLPPADIERDYLRLHEIPVYLDSCSDLYRPLAETLIAAGPRISETLALRKMDLELSEEGGVIVVHSTKSKKFRAVEVGRGLVKVLSRQLDCRAEMPGGDAPDALIFVMPVRTRKQELGRWEGNGDGEAMSRTTVSRDWHKAALQDAALRDMPLHALRHTAAAAWLAGGNSLKYVKDQLGHADITTTERYYGHLERSVRAAGPAATEAAIARAVRLAA